MRTVRHLLEAKAPEVFAIGPDEPVIDAIRLMAEKRIGAVVVMQAGRLVGILSERDYARKIVLQGRSSKDTPVRDIMTSDVISVGLNDTADRCMQLVTDKRIRHLPVLDGGNVLGVVSIGDLVKAVIEDQQLELDQLQRYIASGQMEWGWGNRVDDSRSRIPDSGYLA
jgi:CBS domain-containing protein